MGDAGERARAGVGRVRKRRVVGREGTGGGEKRGAGLHPPQRERGAMESIAPSWCKGGSPKGREGEQGGVKEEETGWEARKDG